MVYVALAPYPAEGSLEELAEPYFEQNYSSTLKQQPAPPSEVWASIHYHLTRMKEREIVHEI